MKANPTGVIFHVYMIAQAVAVGFTFGPQWASAVLGLGIVALLAS